MLGMGLIAYVLKEPRRVFISEISPLEFERSENDLLNKKRHWVGATLLVAASIGWTPWIVLRLQNSYCNKNYIQALSSPIEQSIWEGPGVVTGDVWKPIFLEASQTRQSLYFAQENINNFGKSMDHSMYKKNIVYLSLAYYTPKQSSKLLLNDKNCFYNPNIWSRVTSENLKITLQNKKTLNIIENVVEVNGVKRLIWSWYCVRGFAVQPNSYLFSLIDLTKRLPLRSEGSAAIVISSPLTDSLEESRMRLHLFLEDKYRSIDMLSN
jgi:EpsI family protein